jgi:hypothetical protein
MTHPILDTIDRNAKVIFYPSSCNYSDEFQDVPYDVVVLNSRSSKEKRRIGKVYCLDYDNNELLGLFYANGIKISAIVIIRDGCGEGGNYECIAQEGFFGRSMPVMADQFDYFCDHEQLPFDVPARFLEFETPSYLEPFIKNSDPLNDIRSFHIEPFSLVEKDFVLGHIRVRVIRDSIWRDLDHSDLAVVKKVGSTWRSVPNYLAGLMPNFDWEDRFEFITHSQMRSIRHVLMKADGRKLSRLTFMPIANGSYKRIVSDIQYWEKDYPREISFYHLNAGDFQYINSL